MSPQNPDLDSEALLALPLTQLVQKLHRGELSPEAALFTYIGKVRPQAGDCLDPPSLCKGWGETWPGVTLSGPGWGLSARGCQELCA